MGFFFLRRKKSEVFFLRLPALSVPPSVSSPKTARKLRKSLLLSLFLTSENCAARSLHTSSIRLTGLDPTSAENSWSR